MTTNHSNNKNNTNTNTNTRAPRHVALLALMTMWEDNGYSTIVLDNMLKQENLLPQDRSFCSAIFYGVISRNITLEYIIKEYSKIDFNKLSPNVVALLKCGIYQMKYMDNVPVSAAVNETVELARKVKEEKSTGFINGVLRSFERGGMTYKIPKDKLTATSIAYSVPMPLIQLWRKAYGQDKTMEILEGLDTVPPVFVRVNTTKITQDKLMEMLLEETITAEPYDSIDNCIKLSGHGGIARIKSFRKGFYHVQDGASQRCAAATMAGENMRVLDVCGAPGGKSFTMSEMMGNTGEIVCCDLYQQRLSMVTEGAKRLGLTNIKTICQDATIQNPSLGEFDVVLCDVVCSGFGIIRRKPEIKYKPLETLDGITDVQYNILEVSSTYLKQDGCLIYSTCTLNPCENEEVVDKFLANHPDFILAKPMETRFPQVGGTDGFFHAVIKKK